MTTRVAYTEVHNDQSALTAVGVLHRAVEWLADRGVAIERNLSDNGGAYRSHLWRDTCEAPLVCVGVLRWCWSNVCTLTNAPNIAVEQLEHAW